MQSPYLQYPADNSEVVNQMCDFRELINPTIRSLDFLSEMMDKFYSSNIILKHEQAHERIGSMQNRIQMMHIEEEKH